jgi:hypothetical protein
MDFPRGSLAHGELFTGKGGFASDQILLANPSFFGEVKKVAFSQSGVLKGLPTSHIFHNLCILGSGC